MHHIDLEAIMGEHIDLVDRMMMSAIVSTSRMIFWIALRVLR